MNKIKISIITPVYNVEKYLTQCIESIIKQTFVNWELLLIDDGSKDQSGKICDKYATMDNRIKVFHKENGGVSSARNMGLDKAVGTWVTFIDSDDCIEPGFLEGLYKPIAANEEVDFVHGGCQNMIDGKIVSVNQSYEYYIGNEPDILYLKLRGLIVSKLLNTHILKEKGLRFDENMKIAEDMAFILDYALNIKRYALVPEKGYHYRRDNLTSATNSIQLPQYHIALNSFYHLYASIRNYINKYQLKDEVAKLRLGYEAIHLQDVCMSLYYYKYSKKERLNHLKTDFDNEHLELLKLAEQDKIKSRIFSLLRKKRYILFDFLMEIFTNFKKIKGKLS